ncbi:hypothetical protein M0805_006577 [Coniferiporia weirii]|nr:hypothetical protein M0805_006577 [Coniferiporia weirii]
MAAPALFSQHSSNPLEVPTSDPQNARYRRQIERMHQRRLNAEGGMHAVSSSDPIAGYQVTEEMQGYHHHISRLFPGITSIVKRKGSLLQAQEPLQRTLQELPVYSSDDELDIVPNDDPDLMKDQATIPDDGQMLADAIVDPDMADQDMEFEEPEDEDETDEEMSILLKPAEEREEIEEEIADLEDAVPQLSEDYKVVDRLGTGTFSSVYKALDLGYESKWHNGAWLGHHPPESSAHYQSSRQPPGSKVFVAIKRIYVTSNPERIRNEIAIMEDCRGCRHVSQLITAFRHRDQVVAIMPYHRNDDFRDFYKTLPMTGIKAYFRCLLRALRDIHTRGIIHRDVKPANFLFDSRANVGTLCDFGLACRVDFNARPGHCLHTPATREHIHGQKKSSKLIDIEMVKSMQREARQKSVWSSDRVGYPEKDMRPHSKANRAGTRGFRAPEVLLKCNEQTGAIDIWSVGMILLFFLTGKFPLFQSNDDIEALMEITVIIGRRRMECAATLHSRTFATNVPSVTRDGMTWREFVEKNNPDILHMSSPPASPSSSSTSASALDSPSNSETYLRDLEQAFDLLEKLLSPESIHRITARDALYHPFLAETKSSASADGDPTPDVDADLGDDAFFPHPVGGGCCGKYHIVDEVTEEHSVRIPGPRGMQVRSLQAGQGIPIGNRPCEFHRHLEEFQQPVKNHVQEKDGHEENTG